MRPIDLTGNRYSLLTVLSRTDLNRVRVRCDCGNIVDVQRSHLLSGAKKHCGCIPKGFFPRSTAVDISGRKFGRLRVIERSDFRKNRAIHWKCICDCGTEKIAMGSMLKNGKVKSCGCLQADHPNGTSHGKSRTVQYALLHGAKTRARLKGLPFDLTLETLPAIPEFCPLLGVRLTSAIGRGNATASSPTLDRIVPSLGYVKGNVQVISRRANTIKSDASFAEFEAIYRAWRRQQEKCSTNPSLSVAA